MRPFLLLLCFVIANPAALYATQRHSQASPRPERRSVPCASAWIKPDGTVVYPEPIQWLEAEYDCRPNDEELQSQLSQTLVDFAATLLGDDCVERAAAYSAALALARRAARIDPSNRRARRMVETYGELAEAYAQLEVYLERLRNHPPRPLPEMAIPIPAGSMPAAMPIPNRPIPSE